MKGRITKNKNYNRQVGSGGIRAITGQHAPMTMDQILQLLISKARTEAEEAQRILLFSLNALAGLMALDANPAGAVAAYRCVPYLRIACLRCEIPCTVERYVYNSFFHSWAVSLGNSLAAVTSAGTSSRHLYECSSEIYMQQTCSPGTLAC